MALSLVVTKRGVVHVPSCIRLTKGAHAAITEPWTGGPGVPCRSCMFPKQAKRRRPLPCRRCRQVVAKPCVHNGVMRAHSRAGEPGRRGGAGSVQRILNYPDLALEKDWLHSLLDS